MKSTTSRIVNSLGTLVAGLAGLLAVVAIGIEVLDINTENTDRFETVMLWLGGCIGWFLGVFTYAVAKDEDPGPEADDERSGWYWQRRVRSALNQSREHGEKPPALDRHSAPDETAQVLTRGQQRERHPPNAAHSEPKASPRGEQ